MRDVADEGFAFHRWPSRHRNRLIQGSIVPAAAIGKMPKSVSWAIAPSKPTTPMGADTDRLRGFNSEPVIIEEENAFWRVAECVKQVG